jgi:hypothetical protein
MARIRSMDSESLRARRWTAQDHAVDLRRELDAALAELGWAEMLSDMPERRYRWCSGCWAKPVRTHRFSTT